MIKIIALLSTLFICLYGAIFLFATSSKKYRNRFFLGLFFLNSTILFIGHFLSFNEYWTIFRYWDFIFFASLLAFYPLYYWYIYSAFNFNVVSTKWLYHFIPSIIIAVLMLTVVLTSNWSSYQEYMNYTLYGTELTSKDSKNLVFLYKGARYFHLVQILFYNIITIRLLMVSKNKMDNVFSNLDKYQLKYFYIITISFILLMSIPGFYVTAIGRQPFNDDGYLLLLMCTLFTLLYIILAIIGMIQIPVEINLSNSNQSNEFDKIENHDINLIEKKLLVYFQNEKPWLNPHLNILDVAKHIGSNRSYVSKIINEKMGCNFNFFVNTYRINEAKILLKKIPELTIAQISESSGFGSVNSFLRIFKSIENKTPTKFRKET